MVQCRKGSFGEQEGQKVHEAASSGDEGLLEIEMDGEEDE
jgi:hypothetical protein